jgi:hypothetical protein
MTINIDNIDLQAGNHRSPYAGMCLLEACSYVAGEPFSDRPECVSPILGAFGRRLNDNLGHEDRQTLKQYIPRMLNTADDGKEEARRYLLGDWAYRVALPRWLDLAGKTAEATSLRALAPITDKDTLAAARALIDGMYDNVWDARRAAYAKLREAIRTELAKHTATSPDAVAVAVVVAEAAEVVAVVVAEAAEVVAVVVVVVAEAAEVEAEAAAAAVGKPFDYWAYRKAVRDALRAHWDAQDASTPGTFAYVRQINKTEGIELLGRLIAAA